MIRRKKIAQAFLILIVIVIVTRYTYLSDSSQSLLEVKKEIRYDHPDQQDGKLETSLYPVNARLLLHQSQSSIESNLTIKATNVFNNKSDCQVEFDFNDNNRMLVVHEKKFNANCPLLFKGDKKYARSIKKKLKGWKVESSDLSFMNDFTSDCSKTFQDFTHNFYVSSQEKAFPLAFEFLVYYTPLRIQQYLRLLKNIYRPQNVYCIHIDGKAPDWWTNLFISFANCFPNIIIAKKRIKVNYATSGILYAHFECFQDLLKTSYKWKYVITLHGTELPLVTNREMVNELQKMNGTNLIQKGEDSSNDTAQSHPWITYKVKSIDDGRKIILTNETLGPIPYNLKILKSAASANSALSRNFISFIFTDKRSLALAEFLKDVRSAVEMFFNTINLLPEAPGGYHSFHGNGSSMPLVAKRYWVFRRKTFKKFCFGRKLVHNICIVGAGDLVSLGRASENQDWWFHNKYFIEYDHVVMNCMENLLLQRNANEYKQDCLYNSSF